MLQWPRTHRASSVGLAWLALRLVMAYAVQVFQFPVREIGRTRRVMRMALAACGNGSPAATAAVFRLRRSCRPWPWFCWLWPVGMSFQGRFLIVAYRPGWFFFTIRM
jgi:hypothetical protein